jgi:fucose 4-O-acetylase-like acetyltransferase
MRQTLLFLQERAAKHPAIRTLPLDSKVPGDLPNLASSEPARSSAIDFMRAVAILLVVFGHAQRGLFQTGQVSGIYWDMIYPVVDYFIYVFHIPVFFATSGFLLERHSEQSPRQFATRVGRLALLYLLWNAINAIPAVVFLRFINRSFGRAGYLDAINPVHINGIMWFFVALIFAHTFYFVTQRHALMRWLAIGLCVVTLAIDADFHGAAYGSVWLLIGAEVSRLKLIDGRHFSRPRAGWFLLAYIIAGALSYAIGIAYYLAIPACAFGLLALYSFGQTQVVQPKFLTFVGKNTLSIYVMHVLAVAGLRIVFISFFQVRPSAILIVVLTFVGVAIPLIAVALFRRLQISRLLLLD